MTEKDRFSFAAENGTGDRRSSGRKLKRSCGELNRSVRSVMGIECRSFGYSDSEEGGAEVQGL